MWLNNSELIIFYWRFNQLQQYGDRSVRRCEKILFAGPKLARNISTSLSPNPARLSTLLETIVGLPAPAFRTLRCKAPLFFSLRQATAAAARVARLLSTRSTNGQRWTGTLVSCLPSRISRAALWLSWSNRNKSSYRNLRLLLTC